MVEYYRRVSAGLILTEGTWVSREAIGFINVPGIYSKAQVEGWTLGEQSVTTWLPLKMRKTQASMVSRYMAPMST